MNKIPGKVKSMLSTSDQNKPKDPWKFDLDEEVWYRTIWNGAPVWNRGVVVNKIHKKNKYSYAVKQSEARHWDMRCYSEIKGTRDYIPTALRRICDTSPPRQGFTLSVGDKVECLSLSNVLRPCTVISLSDDTVRVHYDGYKEKHDEDIPKDSPRLCKVLQSPLGSVTRVGQMISRKTNVAPDVELRMDGVTIPMHRLMLSLRSKIFDMDHAAPEENGEQRQIIDVKSCPGGVRTFAEFCKYFYDGLPTRDGEFDLHAQVRLDDTTAEGLLELATQWDVPILVNGCVDYMVQSHTFGSLELLVIAERVHNRRLFKAAADVILQHLQPAKLDPVFKRLRKRTQRRLVECKLELLERFVKNPVIKSGFTDWTQGQGEFKNFNIENEDYDANITWSAEISEAGSPQTSPRGGLQTENARDSDSPHEMAEEKVPSWRGGEYTGPIRAVVVSDEDAPESSPHAPASPGSPNSTSTIPAEADKNVPPPPLSYSSDAGSELEVAELDVVL